MGLFASLANGGRLQFHSISFLYIAWQIARSFSLIRASGRLSPHAHRLATRHPCCYSFASVCSDDRCGSFFMTKPPLRKEFEESTPADPSRSNSRRSVKVDTFSVTVDDVLATEFKSIEASPVESSAPPHSNIQPTPCLGDRSRDLA